MPCWEVSQVPELQIDAARLRAALTKAEADLVTLRRAIANQQEAITEDERRAARMEQMVVALRSRLAAAGEGER